MGLEFLARVRRTAFGAALFVALYAAVYASYAAGLGFGAGAMWSLMQLWLLEKVVVGLTSPATSERQRMARTWLPGLAHVAMLGVGAVLLFNLPAAWLAAGFTLPFAIILLKTVSRMLLESLAWKRFVSSRWQPALLLAVVVAGLWFLSGQVNRAEAGASQPSGAHATETHDAHGSADAHATTDASHSSTDAAHGDAHAAGGHGDGHGEAAPGPKKFDTFLSILVKAGHGTPWGDFIHKYEAILFSLLVATILSIFAFLATRNPKMVPGPLQNLVEALVSTIYDQIVAILGPKYGPRYVPFLGSLFIYILGMNYFGVFPLMESPTANLNVTLALALTVFVYVQYSAIKEAGPLGYLDHLAGSPRTPVEWALVPLLLPIHVIGELAKPVSLSCRLFGNIFGEDMLLVGFATLGITAVAAMGLGALPFGLPLHFVFLFLVMLTGFVQALVFSMLSTIYFLLMLPHDHGHDHDHGHGEEAHHPAH